MNEDENRLPLRPTQPGRPPISKLPTMQSRLARNVKRRSISIANNRDKKQARLENTESATSSSTGTSASSNMSSSATSLSTTSNRAPNNRPRVTIAGNEAGNLSVPRGLPKRVPPPSTTFRRPSPAPVRPALLRQASSSSLLRRESSPRRNDELELLKRRIAELEGNLDSTRTSLNDTRELLQAKGERFDIEREKRALLEEKLKEEHEKLKEEQEKVDEGKKRQEELEKTNQELKQKHEEELAERDRQINELKNELRQKDDAMRALHNDVVDLRGQIRVGVRVRPLLPKESSSTTEHISFPEPGTIQIEGGGKFTFNHIFPQHSTQQQVFNQVEELILSALHGYNVSVMAYGQTGSGKTHSMRGGWGESAGLIPRAVDFLFSEAKKLEQLDWMLSFSGSFYEVYLDGAFDLLSDPPRNKLEMKTTETGTTLPGLTSLPLHSPEDMTSLLSRSDKHRSTAATKSNDQSSRSHAIFSFKIEGENTKSGSKISSTLNIVDLAGSERQKDTGAEGQQFKEMTAINMALSNLKNVIRALYDKTSHVPYRSNILTRLLANTLGGGKSKCLVVVNLNPSLTNLTETKRSLEFASQMSNTKIGVARKNEH